MAVAPSPAPYYLPWQFAPLSWYRQRGLAAEAWAEEQFHLQIQLGRSFDPDFSGRCDQVLAAMEGLPLQVKDLLRGTIERIRLQPATEFELGTLGVWSPGEVRINADWTLLPPLRRRAQQALYARRLLQATLIHESGHALAEDPRGGVPMRALVELLLASGWLPHPVLDPAPYRATGPSLEGLTAHVLRRLAQVNPRWDPDRPLGAPGGLSGRHLERDLVQAEDTGHRSGGLRGGCGLKPPRVLTEELLLAASQGRLQADLQGVGLGIHDVERVLGLYRPISPYSEESLAETPAEIFRTLYTGPPLSRDSAPALRSGYRVLIRPWRVAELELGPREPARMIARGPVTALLRR